jgi:hypothetical protein
VTIVHDRGTVRTRPNGILQHFLMDTYVTTDQSYHKSEISRHVSAQDTHRNARRNQHSCGYRETKRSEFRFVQVREIVALISQRLYELVSRCHIVACPVSHHNVVR